MDSFLEKKSKGYMGLEENPSHTCLRGIHLKHERLIRVRQVQNLEPGDPGFEIIEACVVHQSELGFPFNKAVNGEATELKLWILPVVEIGKTQECNSLTFLGTGHFLNQERVDFPTL